MGLPALLVLLFAGLAAVGAVTTKLQCVDAARDAALAAARGESGTEAGQQAAPDGAEVSVTVDGDTVVATVRAPVPVVGGWLPGTWVDASAVAAVEPGSPGPAP
jgi:Flp pilus assembly protein TadG